MDPERQPLLFSTASLKKQSGPLTYDEVRKYQTTYPWRGARLGLVLVFWAVMAVLLSIIAAMLLNHDCTKDLGPAPSVPPVYISFAPLRHLVGFRR